MKTEKVLWQLFSAITACTLTGIAIGYRTSVWFGLIAGSLLAIFMSDWKHAKTTVPRLWNELKLGFMCSFGEIPEPTKVEKTPVVKSACRLGHMVQALLYCLFWFLPVAVGISLTTMFMTNFLPSLYPNWSVWGAQGKDTFGVWVWEGVAVFSVIGALFTAIGCHATFGTEKTSNRTTWPIVKIFRTLLQKSHVVPTELWLWDRNGKLLNRKRLGTLFILAFALCVWPLVTVVWWVILSVDTILTLAMAFATSRNTIAGCCTAIGIGLWFWFYPEPVTTLFHLCRLIAFAILGGVVGVAIHKLKEFLAMIEPTEPVKASA